MNNLVKEAKQRPKLQIRKVAINKDIIELTLALLYDDITFSQYKHTLKKHNYVASVEGAWPYTIFTRVIREYYRKGSIKKL